MKEQGHAKWFWLLRLSPSQSLAVVGKLLSLSNGVTLLPLLVKELATFNPLPIFYCNGSVTVTSY